MIRLRWRRDGVFEAEFEVADGVGVSSGVANADFGVQSTERLQKFDESQVILSTNGVTIGAANDGDLRAERVLDELIVSL